MSNIKLLLVVFFSYLVLNAKAQFKIIGLLNVDQSNDVTNASFGHQTNAQGRGFSVTNGLRRVKPISSVPNNIIKVRIIEDQSGAELTNLSAKDVQQISGMVLGTTRTANKSISKINESRVYQPKPQSQQRNHLHLAKMTRINNNMPDNTNRLIYFNNAVNLKSHKIAKYRNRYKSNCRCERIWNCPKIQISVSRCEPNYFLCCF